MENQVKETRAWYNRYALPSFFSDSTNARFTSSGKDVPINTVEEGIDFICSGIIDGFVCIREFNLPTVNPDEPIREVISRVQSFDVDPDVLQFKRVYNNRVVSGALFVNKKDQVMISRSIIAEHKKVFEGSIDITTRLGLGIPRDEPINEGSVRIVFLAF